MRRHNRQPRAVAVAVPVSRNVPYWPLVAALLAAFAAAALGLVR